MLIAVEPTTALDITVQAWYLDLLKGIQRESDLVMILITRDFSVVATGEPPSSIDPPSGCHFRTRCPFAMPRCAAQTPMPTLVSAGHRVSCHLVAAEPTVAGRDEGVR